jgi:lipopolysaccharide/colanic/teichoic acid biosynthesis glycosyltransferase
VIAVDASPPAPDIVRSALKRTFDIAVAGLALVVLLPALLLIALVIVLDSRGPVFYRATRVGFRGRPLRMLKFRKMRADAKGAGLTVADDARLTRFGAWLARTKLDELPQLWHVLRGEMSLVGPRPECPTFACHYPRDYDLILSVRPGITGYTQIAFAREASILDPRDPAGHYSSGLLPQKVALDELYAGRLSLRRDMRILIATMLTLVLGWPVAVNRKTGALTRRRRPAPAAAVDPAAQAQGQPVTAMHVTQMAVSSDVSD